MLSLENISIVKCAILVGLSPEVKREILCTHQSEFHIHTLVFPYYRKQQWNEIVEKKAREILKHRGLPEKLLEKVINILLAVGLRMLTWAVYHEGRIGFTRYFTIDFLRYSHFTTLGVIDNEKAAEDLMKDKYLSIRHKYKLACIYCFEDHIGSLFKKIVGSKTKWMRGPANARWMQTPEIVKFWSLQQRGMVEECSIPLYRHRLQQAIKSGSKAAVKYSWSKTGFSSRECTFSCAVTQVLENMKSRESDWIVFRRLWYDDRKESWIPHDYYVDILCFFLSNMTEEQQRQALERSIKGLSNENRDESGLTTVFDCFLCWPYQDYFMKTVTVLWEIIPKSIFAILLLKICEKMEPKKDDLLCGEEKCYDYKSLLKDFWFQSPEHFKNYVLRGSYVIYNGHNVRAGIELLLKLLSLENFIYEEEKIIWLILYRGTWKERAKLMSAKWWKSCCIDLIKEEKFHIFDRLQKVFFKTEERKSIFNKELRLDLEARKICKYFFKYNKFNAVVSLFKRIPLSESELNHLKKLIVYSSSSRLKCLELISSQRNETFEELINWFLPSKDEAESFKTYLISNNCYNHPHFKETKIFSIVHECIISSHRTVAENEQFKKDVVYACGYTVCEELISRNGFRIYEDYDSTIRGVTVFKGGLWNRVENFLNWFLSETEKRHFKKQYFERVGVRTHFSLIKAKQWYHATRFFDWLGLSLEEIKSLKEKTIFRDRDAWKHFHYLVFAKRDDQNSKLEEIDLYLRWHLTNMKAVRKFRDAFFGVHKNYDEADLKAFNLIIENYLHELGHVKDVRTREEEKELFFSCLDDTGRERKPFDLYSFQKRRLAEYEEQKQRDEKRPKKMSERFVKRIKIR